MWLFPLLILWPLVEIGLFVTVGGWLGLWLSLAIVIGTAVLGGFLLRLQGPLMMAEARGAFGRKVDPARLLGGGVLRVLGAILLILPGFLTDILGLLLLLPPVQAGVMALIARRIVVVRPDMGRDGGAIEGDWSRVEPDAEPREPGSGSGWTRH
jgi:UPF0716 protein FxsA